MILNDVNAKAKPTKTGLKDCLYDQRRKEHPFNNNYNNNHLLIHHLSKFELKREKR